VLAHGAYDALGGLLEQGQPVLLGIVPATRATADERALTERVLRFLDQLGFDPESVGENLVVTPTCGLAGAEPGWARDALAMSRRVAANLTP
jgi:hypothetical protein